jgi:hypothetical protein
MLSTSDDSLTKLARNHRGTRLFLALGLGHLKNVTLHGRPHAPHQSRRMAYPKCGAVAIASSFRGNMRVTGKSAS